MLVRTQDLKDALRIILCCIPRKTLKPILECCKITFNEEGIMLEATDLDNGACVCVPSIGGEETEGSIVVNAKQLALFSGKGSDDEIQLSLNKNNLLLGNARMRSAEPVEDFPTIPIPPAKGCKIYPLDSDFPQAVKFVVPAIAGYGYRYALNGINLDFRRGRLVATDGKRLHCAPLGKQAAIPAAIVPPLLLKKVVPDSIIIPPPTKIKEDGKVVKRISHVFLSIPNGICCIRVIDGYFPDYADLVPKSCPSRIEVERDALLQCLKRIKRAVSAADQKCSLVANGRLELHMHDEDEGIECFETIPCEMTGAETSVGLNPVYLYDCIAGLQTETVSIYLQGDKPMVIENEEGWFGLVMPFASQEVNSS